MSRAFIENRVNSNLLKQAKEQQEYLAYFTRSNITKDITPRILDEYAKRNYATSDIFLNWVKTALDTDNFISFFKYFRQPIASSELINDRIIPSLRRVFFSEDSHSKYTLRGDDIAFPYDDVNEKLFNALMFKHNNILVHDLENINKPFRHEVDIENIVSIDSHDDIIHRIAFRASSIIDGKKIKGYLYIDNQSYEFYDEDLNIIKGVPHDLGFAPVNWISPEAYTCDVIRKSIFTHTIGSMEDYVFLKTLLRMAEPYGVFPIVVRPEGAINGKTPDKEPMSTSEIREQSPKYHEELMTSKAIMQPGSEIAVPLQPKPDGTFDHEIIQNFLKFFHMPVEVFKYITEKVERIEQGIIISILGDYSEANEAAKNELQISKSYVSKEDKLRSLSNAISKIRTLSDRTMLGLEYGVDNITADYFQGSDFFLESQADIYALFEKAPNPIERKSLMIRLSQSRNKFNKDKAKRDKILYLLMPFASDKDFEQAVSRIDNLTFSLQNRFDYWINQFEAQYGDIVKFWDAEGEKSNAEKLIIINNLIYGIITEETNSSNASLPGQEVAA